MGIISELNIIPYVEIIWYKKLMWFHRLINSDANRMARIKLVEQIEENDDNWYTELREYADRNGINIKEDHVRTVSYHQYNDHVKTKIRQKVTANLRVEKRTRTKLRHIDPGKQQDYIDHCTIREASTIMKIRLHMICARGNYGGGICRACNEQEESTEHILSCQTNKELVFDTRKVSDVVWLKRASKVYDFFEEQFKK